jgi:regulator of sirC expression with transglutaminase-like and TPR domain
MSTTPRRQTNNELLEMSWPDDLLPYGDWWLSAWAKLQAGTFYLEERDSPLTVGAMLLAAHGSRFLPTVSDMHKEIDALNKAIDSALALIDTAPPNTNPITRWRAVCITGLQLSGDTHTYHDQQNSFLPEIRRRRVGIPIGLAVMWLHVATRMNIRAFGVGMPGHFLVGAHDPRADHQADSPVYFDCFGAGQQLSENDCTALYETMFAERQHPSFNNQFLKPVSNEAILTRMIANLKQNAARRRDLSTLLELARLRWFLPTPSVDEGREVVRLCVALGRAGEAKYWLDQVVERFADDYPAGQRLIDLKVVTAGLN